MLPFTQEQFFSLFAQYNAGIRPVQIVACLLGLTMVTLLLRPSPAGSRVIGAGLAAMWAWTGIAYHWTYFSAINKAAFGFGALFVIQAAVFLYFGALRDRLRFGAASGPLAWLGWALVGYAALLYPLLGLGLGHPLAEIPMFGVTPCPVTIFTFGLLLLASSPVSRWILVIPFLWSLVGGSAAFLLGVPQDWLLLISGGSAFLIAGRDRAVRGQGTTVHA
jgi:hypothetical protein